MGIGSGPRGSAPAPDGRTETVQNPSRAPVPSGTRLHASRGGLRHLPRIEPAPQDLRAHTDAFLLSLASRAVGRAVAMLRLPPASSTRQGE